VTLPTYFKYWGKADPKYEGEPKWHPLVYHSLDVAACTQAILMQRPAWSDTLQRLSGLPPEKLNPWILFLSAFHDIGKFGHAFQGQKPDLQEVLQGRSTAVPRGEKHPTVGYALGRRKLLDWLGRSNNDGDLSDLVQPWLAAATGHHGRPPANLDIGQSVKLIRDNFPAEVLSDSECFVKDVVSLLVVDGFPLPDPEHGLAEKYARLSWLLAGLLVVTDWLGSNTRWFRYREPTLSLAEYWDKVARKNAKKAIQESGLSCPAIAPFEGFRTLFPKIANPTPLQDWAQEVHMGDGPQLFVLEDLTGSGKTEAALTLAARMLGAGKGQGIYLALPTMATADSMFDRIREGDLWRRFFARTSNPSLILAHSASRLKLRLEELNRKESRELAGEESTASVDCTAWLSDSRKKALVADFGVGTIDQALIGVLPIRHQSLRLVGLSSKVLIVDEVHACDAYMGKLLERLLTFHAALGGSAILLSATLPLDQRQRYITSFSKGIGMAEQVPEKKEYPLSSCFCRAGLHERPIEARTDSARRIIIIPLNSETMVFELLKENIHRGRCGVWVRNTVVEAIETWKAWNKQHPGLPATLYHARFALIDRLRIGRMVEDAFGIKSTPESRKSRLVISTQVIEQSLDVDFDAMVSDLAPIDLVIQRAGRLQRHVRDAEGALLSQGAKDGRGKARLGVLMPPATDDVTAVWPGPLLPKTGAVYADRGWLWLTAQWLEQHALEEHGGFDLASQARDMIEHVYAENAFERLPKGLTRRSDTADGNRRGARSAAQGASLALDEGYSPSSLQWQDEIVTPTRLVDYPTVRVRLARCSKGGLVPWATLGDRELAWSLSDLSIPEYFLSSENPRLGDAIKAARETMPDQGRHVLILPLEHLAEELWRGLGLNENGEQITLDYSPLQGLSLNKGVKDESDH
jgi:CRISPR-associated endonuclease/helicase Cas3